MMTQAWRMGAWALLAMGAGLWGGCEGEEGAQDCSSPVSAIEVEAARARVQTILAPLRDLPHASAWSAWSAWSMPGPRRVEAKLGERADLGFEVLDRASSMRVDVSLLGARPAQGVDVDGFRLYSGGYQGVFDVLARVGGEGIEDFLYFEKLPAEAEIVYSIGVEGAAGLRLIAGSLELLDASGAPRLRMASPWGISGDGKRFLLDVQVRGCEYDTDPAPPFRRAVVAPGAERCEVRLRWDPASVRAPLLIDPAWSSTGALMLARDRHTATLLPLSGLVLVAGGRTAMGVTATCEVYDEQSGAWASTGAMATARQFHTASVLPLSGAVLIVGGEDTTGQSLASAEKHFQGVWSSAGQLNTARTSHSATALADGRVLVVGGLSGASVNATAELYQPGANAWSQAAAPLVGRYRHSATRLSDGGVLVTGGYGSNGLVATSQVYEPMPGQWNPVASMARLRVSHQSITLPDGRVVVVGGADALGNAMDDVEIFTKAPLPQGKWVPGVPLLVKRKGLGLSFLHGGHLLVTGGQGPSALSSAEVYDYVTDSWPFPSLMATARMDHAQVELPSGAVLVVGGSDAGVFWSSAEVFGGRAMGEQCNTTFECLSGVCANGVCCSGPCDGPCEACTIAAGGLLDGTCTTAKEGTPSAGCAPYLCDGMATSCPSTCAGDADCAAGNYCDATGTCVVQRALSEACDQAAMTTCWEEGCAVCASGFCVDGVCCDSACDGPCDACSQALGADADGICTLFPEGATGSPSCAPFFCSGTSNACNPGCEDDGDCVSGSYCAASGICEPSKQLGQSCSLKADCKVEGCRVCLGLDCVDGFCCDSLCTGQCEACDGAIPGICSAIEGIPHGNRPACESGETTCGNRRCDGKSEHRDSCTFPGSDVLCIVGCSENGDNLDLGLCSGDGACDRAFSAPCSPFKCESAASTCMQTCATSADCARGFVCEVGDGSPSVCVPSATCVNVDDCTPPLVCDERTNTCVPPQSFLVEPLSNAGCACQLGGDGRPSGPYLVSLSVLLLARRRWRSVKRRRMGI